MKKIISFSLVVIFSFILTGCKPVEKNNTETNSSQSKLSIKDIVSRGEAQKCKVEIRNENMSTVGEILIKGNKFKQINSTKNAVAGTEITTYTIGDGEWIYSWNNMNPGQGMKFKTEEEEKQPENQKNDYQNFWGQWEQDNSFKCEPINISDSEFNLPTGVKFVDFQEEIQSAQEKAAGSLDLPADLKETQCQACEQSPDQASALECKKMFGCE